MLLYQSTMWIDDSLHIFFPRKNRSICLETPKSIIQTHFEPIASLSRYSTMERFESHKVACIIDIRVFRYCLFSICNNLNNARIHCVYAYSDVDISSSMFVNLL